MTSTPPAHPPGDTFAKELENLLGCPLRIVGEPTVEHAADGTSLSAIAESDHQVQGTLQPAWRLASLSAPGQNAQAPRVWALAFCRIAGRWIRSAASDHIALDRTATGWTVAGWEHDIYDEWANLLADGEHQARHPTTDRSALAPRA